MGRRGKLITLAAIALIIVQVLLETWIPSQTARITTMIQTEGSDLQAINRLGIRMIIGALVAFLCACMAGYMISVVGCNSCALIRMSLFEKVLGFSTAEVSSFGTSSLIVRCTGDVSYIQSFLQDCLQPLAQAPILLIAVFLRMSFANTAWLWLGVGAAFVLFVLLIYIMLATLVLFKKGGKTRDKMASVSREHVCGIRVIHAFNAEKPYDEDYRKINEELTHFYTRSKKVLSTFSPVVTSLLYGMSVAIYVIGAGLIANTALAERTAIYSDMVAYVSYIALLIQALVNIVMIVLYIPQVLYADYRILAVLNTQNSIRDGQETGSDLQETGTLEFRDVSFRYPHSNENAVSNLTFRARKGQTVAIIGATGSGKTSLLNLIPRLYDVKSGEVLVDGVDVREYQLSALRSRIGYVPQTSFLFSGTIRSNIGYGEGRFRATLEQIRDAANIGQADEFIRQKEGQYDAAVLTGGSNFSGGQRQRLTISRAICRDPEIYIFDDSFSALDFKTDSKLRKALKKTAAGATILIVSQRISTIRDADLIIVVDKGKIVGQGTHEELMASCSVYREFALSQEREQVAG